MRQWSILLGDLPKPECGAGHTALGVPDEIGFGADESRDPLQPQPFCASVNKHETHVRSF